MDVPSLMRQAVDFYSDRPAIMTVDRAFTFEEAWQRGVQLANWLIETGVSPGDRVASVEDNNIGAADMMIGCAIAGAARVPLYARNSREAHAHMLTRTDTKVVFADPAYGPSVSGLEDEIPSLQHVVIRGTDYDSWLASQSAKDPMVPVDPDSTCVIRHSAGTTGHPHGVGYSHRDWLVTCRNFYYRLPNLERDSVVGHAAPVSHGSGYLFLPAWLHGCTNVLFGAFEPQSVLQQMESYRVSHMFAAPSIVAALAAVPDVGRRDWSSLRCILVGGGPITDATAYAGRDAFGEVLYQIFGQTEAATLTEMTPAEWFGTVEGSTPMRAAGKILPFTRLEIRDAEGTALPIGSEGEIYAQVEGQLRAFWNEPELTASRLIDGWVRTGDIGRLDDNGYLYVLDRAEDLIVSGGFNIWPAELETAIADQPEILDVAVFGVPHEKWGETPLALCSVEPDAKVTAEDIVALVAQRLGSYKKPAVVEFTTEPLPKSPTGKLQRKVLREPYWADREARVGGA
ncbi:class I adenylate-forming enzyme family protein [Sciscionella marina]|uniref:class I adenylate-forming enzyme family protein n=1 Tax=Sciscionella marina TaxID=508770 RepID=UPI000366D4CA|nr:AMP-binding protein [Sciscionella marina]